MRERKKSLLKKSPRLLKKKIGEARECSNAAIFDNNNEKTNLFPIDFMPSRKWKNKNKIKKNFRE